jgi:NAD(P)-dependent dehydrogenase (short-subunit alcohol dehydrogenase family)
VSDADFSDRTVLVTGGSSGTGLALVRELHRLGATVVVGTRRPERYAKIATELGALRVHPFVADLTDLEQASTQLRDLLAGGPRPTDVVHSAAGGLEPILRQLMRKVIALRKVAPAELEGALEQARSEIRELVAANRSHAYQVNFDAPTRLLEEAAAALPEGGSLVFYSSLWSSFYGRVPTPQFYAGVAESKLALESWLEERAPAWAERRITTAIISGHTAADTSMGEVIDRHLAPLLGARQERFRGFFITAGDMVGATIDVLRLAGRADAPGGLLRRYLHGPGRVFEELSADTESLADTIPL